MNEHSTRKQKLSLSVRRAWIEIVMPAEDVIVTIVALREESVD